MADEAQAKKEAAPKQEEAAPKHPPIRGGAEESAQSSGKAEKDGGYKEAPGGFAPASEQAAASQEKSGLPVGEKGGDNPLDGLTRRELVRLRTAIDAVLDPMGQDSEIAPAGPSVKEKAQALPINEEASEKVSVAEAAKKVGFDKDKVVDHSVRQAANPKTGEAFGDKYLGVATSDGQKKYVKL